MDSIHGEHSLHGADSLRRPWPFTGRGEELDLVRRHLTAGHRGIALTGAPGSGKTRLGAEAVRVLRHTLVTGTAAARGMPFGAFAHVLPGTVSLHQAAALLRDVRVLVVDDAHLLDDASAALVHLLAVHGPARLLVLARPGGDAPDAVARLWTADLLPALSLGPLPPAATAVVLADALGGEADAITARRLHRACRGDLWLLRELVAAAAVSGRMRREHGGWTWRGPLPVTSRVRELALAGLGPQDLTALELVARGEPLAAGRLPAGARERLEERGLIGVDGRGLVWLADRLDGAYRPGGLKGSGGLDGLKGSDRLNGSDELDGPDGFVGLGGPDGPHGPDGHNASHRTHGPAQRSPHVSPRVGVILAAECRELEERARDGEVRAGATVGAGQRLVEEDGGRDEPLLPRYCAGRAALARLRGELCEAVAWSREGLRRRPEHGRCRAELAHAAAYLGDLQTAGQALAGHPAPGAARTWLLAAEGDTEAARGSLGADGSAFALHDAVRLGVPGLALHRLDRLPGELAALLAGHAAALLAGEGPDLDRVARRFEERGLLLHAAEAHAQAARAHRAHRDCRAAQAAQGRAAALAHRCGRARTPALADVAFGGLTARQRQIAALAAAGLTNRQIAEKLSLSVRTVGNHLYSAYTRLGSSDRTALAALG